MPYPQEVIDQMQEELIALVEAWVDRGIPPSDSAMMLAGISHLMIMKFTDLKFDELMELAREQWEQQK